MKQKILIQLLILLCSLTSHAQIPKPFVIPELKEWKGAEGTFTPTNGGRIVYSARQPELKTTATTFAETSASCSAVRGPSVPTKPVRATSN